MAKHVPDMTEKTRKKQFFLPQPRNGSDVNRNKTTVLVARIAGSVY
jgi:hypothetical protein